MGHEPVIKQSTISLPYGLALRVESLAKLENRTINELFEDAVRAYLQQRSEAIPDEIIAQANTYNLVAYTEEDVSRVSKEVRAARAIEEKDEVIEEIELDGQTVRTLKNLLRGGLRAVFVGLNPSRVSVERGHYYQGKLGQRFWARLRKHDSALILPKGAEDLAAFQYGYGFTDLVRRPTASAKELTKAEKRKRAVDLLIRLNEMGDHPNVVFHFKDAWDFAAEPLIDAGYPVFKMPGPYAKKEVVDEEMKELIKRLKST